MKSTTILRSVVLALFLGTALVHCGGDDSTETPGTGGGGSAGQGGAHAGASGNAGASGSTSTGGNAGAGGTASGSAGTGGVSGAGGTAGAVIPDGSTPDARDASNPSDANDGAVTTDARDASSTTDANDSAVTSDALDSGAPDASDGAAATDAADSSTMTDSGDGAASDADIWPACDTQPDGTLQSTIGDIWLTDPAQPVAMWVPGVFVTAVSSAGCVANVACEIFVQQSESFASLAAGAHQAIRARIAANAASHFVGVSVGDKVDLAAFASRYTVQGENELLLMVNGQLRGCFHKVGTGLPIPVAATLADLTLVAYESTLGPLLVRLTGVSGKPQLPAESFGLWNTGAISDAGIADVVSLSPGALPGANFGATFTAGHIHDFTSVTGVFSLLFVSPNKYREIRPRALTEVVVGLVH